MLEDARSWLLLFFKRLSLSLLFCFSFLSFLLSDSLPVLLIELFFFLGSDFTFVDLLVLPVLHPNFLLCVISQLFADRIGKQVDGGYAFVYSTQKIDL